MSSGDAQDSAGIRLMVGQEAVHVCARLTARQGPPPTAPMSVPPNSSRPALNAGPVTPRT